MRWIVVLAALALTSCGKPETTVASRLLGAVPPAAQRVWLLDRLDERSSAETSAGLSAALPAALAGCGVSVGVQRIDTWGVSDPPDGTAAWRAFRPDLTLIVGLTLSQNNLGRRSYAFQITGRDRQAREVWVMEWATTGLAGDSQALGQRMAEAMRERMLLDRLLAKRPNSEPANRKPIES